MRDGKVSEVSKICRQKGPYQCPYMLAVNFPSSFWNESEQSRFIQQFGRPRHATPPSLPLHCTADRAPVELKQGKQGREGGRTGVGDRGRRRPFPTWSVFFFFLFFLKSVLGFVSPNCLQSCPSPPPPPLHARQICTLPPFPS